MGRAWLLSMGLALLTSAIQDENQKGGRSAFPDTQLVGDVELGGVSVSEYGSRYGQGGVMVCATVTLTYCAFVEVSPAEAQTLREEFSNDDQKSGRSAFSPN